MLRRILVPLDGSFFAESALSPAINLARKTEGELRLLCVVEPLPETVSRFSESDRRWCEEYLADATARVRKNWTGALSTELREGRAGQEVVAEADEWSADVIVLATHGRGGLTRAWMGSVADYCLRTASQPLMAIRPPEHGSDGTEGPLANSQVVVPLDGSPLAEAALPYGASLASQLGVPLTLLTAVPSPRVADLSYVPDTIDASNQANRYLDGHLSRLRDDELEVNKSVVTDRGAAHAILSQAEGDLVVMCTHGRTGFDRVLFGSVADKVIRGATGAVLAIPPDGKTQREDPATAA